MKLASRDTSIAAVNAVDLSTVPTNRIGRILAGAARVVRVVGPKVRRWIADGQLGPDFEREVGRHTGAKC